MSATLAAAGHLRDAVPKLFFKGCTLKPSCGQTLADCGISGKIKQPLVLLLGKQEACDEPVAAPPAAAAAFSVGEHVEVLWGDGKFHDARILARQGTDAAPTYKVKWDNEETFTQGVQPQYIRKVVAVHLLPPNLTQPVLQDALNDDGFKSFLQSSVFEQMFAPIKQMIRESPESLPQVLTAMRATDPNMFTTLLPFILCELEVSNPSLFTIIATQFNAVGRAPTSGSRGRGFEAH